MIVWWRSGALPRRLRRTALRLAGSHRRFNPFRLRGRSSPHDAVLGQWPALLRRGVPQGFTLLGVLIATGMVLVVVTGLVNLAQRSAAATRTTKEGLIATYLAREGIEFVRSLRDDNFLAFQDASSPPQGRCRTGPCLLQWRGDPLSLDIQEQRRAICNNDSAHPHWVIDRFSCPGACGGKDGPALVAPVGDAPAGELYLSADGTYTHSGTLNVRTPFRRLVEITTLDDPLDDLNAPRDCGESYDISLANPPRPKAFRVKVSVFWGGENRSFELAEVLYPWLRSR